MNEYLTKSAAASFNEVDLNYAFPGAPCASTSCGVVRVADVAACPTPARKSPRRDDWLLWLLRQF